MARQLLVDRVSYEDAVLDLGRRHRHSSVSSSRPEIYDLMSDFNTFMTSLKES